MNAGGQRHEDEADESRRMQAVGRLAAGIAHDFNNVLAAIRGYGQIALRSLDGLVDAGSEAGSPSVSVERATLALLRADVAAIEDSTQRAAALTRQLSALTRPGGDDIAPIELDAFAAAIHSLARRLLPPSLELTLASTSGPVTALANEAALMQVALEVVLDLRDALGEDAWIEIASAYEGPSSTIAVLRFRTAAANAPVPGPRTRRLAHDLLGRAGGELRREGSDAEPVVVVSLPAAPARSATDAEGARTTEVPAGATVLLVEDDAAVRRIARTVLERLGYRVVPAGNGVEALRMVEMLASDDVVPDLLVTDVTMPEMNGPELVAALRRRAPEIGVLFMSGMGEPATASWSGHPREDFLEKPFTLEDLAARVAGLLKRRDV